MGGPSHTMDSGELQKVREQVKELKKSVKDLQGAFATMQTQQVLAAFRKSQDDINRVVEHARERAQEQESKNARDFVNLQISEMYLHGMLVQSALVMAYAEYDKILQVEARKPLSVGGIILSIATITLPELAPIKAGLEDLVHTGAKFEKLIGLVGSELHPYTHFVVEPVLEAFKAEESDDAGLKRVAAGMSIMSQVLQAVFHNAALTLFVTPILYKYIDKLNADGERFIENKVRALWRRAGLKEIGISAQLLNNPAVLDGLRACFLYDMLRAYAQQYCRFDLYDDPLPLIGLDVDENDVANWPDNGDLIGDFLGMDYSKRKQIYERFGGWAWQRDPTRPPVWDYRDMIIKWRLPVRKYRRVDDGPPRFPHLELFPFSRF